MAAAILTGRQRNNVSGHLREVLYTSIVFTNAGDTWSVSGIKNILGWDLAPTTNASYGFTVAGNTMTLQAAAGLTFRGSVKGL